ncbi:MAG TPA: thioredoxin [Rhizomicrobium sp.]|nr:thioredoxin [Rhizomicrobium sp.]
MSEPASAAPAQKSGSTVKVSDASFEADVLNSKTPVVVDFWAEWCGPCKMIAPAIDELAADLTNRVTFAKVNIDENPNIPAKYGVRGVPTLMIFSKGQVAAVKVGALPKSKIKEWIDSSL